MLEQMIDRIPVSQIKSVELQTEQQIRHNVTMTRLLTVGLLALAIPKQRASVLQYLVINLGDESIMLAGDKLGPAYKMLYEIVNK